MKLNRYFTHGFPGIDIWLSRSNIENPHEEIVATSPFFHNVSALEQKDS
jgi:hypothetical protein